jgi:ATP-dependent Zn protease
MRKPQPSIAKLGASLPKAIAYCSIVRTLRSQHRFNLLESGLVVLRLPSHASREHYRSAAEFLTGIDERRHRHRLSDTYVTVIGAKKTETWPSAVGDWFEYSPRVIAFCDSDSEIPFEIQLAADAILDVEAHTVRDVIGAWRMGKRGRISEIEAAKIRDVPFPVLDAAARQGRSATELIDRVIRAAEDLPKQAIEDSQAKSAASFPMLEDLVGMGEAEAWGRELAQDLRDWKSGKIPWSAVDRGILLSGPPGCGKTTFARALANTCGVKLVAESLAQWQSAGYLNALLKAMRAAFDEARRSAPAILFIDEVDAFGDRARFNDHNSQYCTEVISGFLECLDGVEGREGVVVVGAANHPERLDAAITRAGRLDRHVRVSLPDQASRREILDRLFDRQIDAGKLEGVVARLPGRSGADLERLAREAKRRARRAARPIALEDVEASLPPLTPLPPDYRWRVAIHEAGHAIVGRHLKYGVIRRAIVPLCLNDRGENESVGSVEFIQDTTVFRTLARVEVEVATLLAGAAAETLLLGDHAAGVGGSFGSDLHHATALAAAAYRSWGLGGRFVFMEEAGPKTAGLALDPLAYRWVNDLLDRCYETAKNILLDSQNLIERLAAALVDESVLDGAQIDAVLRRSPTNRRPSASRRRPDAA